MQNLFKGSKRWANTVRVRSFGGKNQTGTGRNDIGKVWEDKSARNKRSVWTVLTRSFNGAHFATFPPDLIRTCIEAGCLMMGLCCTRFKWRKKLYKNSGRLERR